MKIQHITEAPDGEKVTFQGVLEGPELAFVVELGINMLMKEGALPFVSKDSFDESALIMDVPDFPQ